MMNDAHAPLPTSGPRLDWRTARFDTAPHRPDGLMSPFGAVLLPVAVFLTAILVGAAGGYLAQWLFVVVIFPLVMGLVLALVAGVAIYFGHVRSRIYAFLVVVIGGVLMVLAMHYAEYRVTLPELPADKQGITFPQFVDESAKEGVVIGRFGKKPDANPTNLGYLGSYIYWGAEALLAIAMCCVGFSAAGMPYCAYCGKWKQTRKLGVVTADPKQAVEAVQGGAPADFVALSRDGEPIAFVAYCCDSCAWSGADLQLQSEKLDKSGNPTFKTLATVTYPSEAVPVWNEALAAAGARDMTDRPKKSRTR